MTYSSKIQASIENQCSTPTWRINNLLSATHAAFRGQLVFVFCNKVLPAHSRVLFVCRPPLSFQRLQFSLMLSLMFAHYHRRILRRMNEYSAQVDI